MVRLALTLALWASIGATAFAASPNFELFRSLCVDTHASPAAAIAAAKADGFAQPMTSITKDLPPLNLEESQYRARLVDDGVLVLVVGRKPFPGGPGMTMNGCALIIEPADSAAEGGLGDWAAVAAVTGGDGQPFYMFAGDPAHRRTATDLDADDLAALARTGDLQIAGASHRPDATVLIYGLVQP
jgi:hypothetical protein